ncbi:MAG TPA: GspH/FimT family pseudopilin [Arenimonas sp.]|uniref:GspH/FimT family pseudopilin n=1 Tax=Arenimonas sp. TaxID=1872635 RepID=UPI002CE36C13|nr:GspH/FimT family pseudopilin [Arenimonas sp.]HMB56422.1 GspH/FimT family pseudopilin [Arenimonas sp.]
MRSERGFNLVELVIVMAIVAILSAAAVPSFRTLIEHDRVAAVSNRLQGEIHRVRQEAILHGHRATLCGSSDGLSCNGKPDWSDGMIVFLDSNGDAKRSDAETLLSVIQASDLNQLLVVSSVGRPTLSFRPDGITRGDNLTLHICSPERQELRQIIVSVGGRSRLAEAKAGASCPI